MVWPEAISLPSLLLNENQPSASLSVASLPETSKNIILASLSLLVILIVCVRDFPFETFNCELELLSIYPLCSKKISIVTVCDLPSAAEVTSISINVLVPK